MTTCAANNVGPCSQIGGAVFAAAPFPIDCRVRRVKRGEGLTVTALALRLGRHLTACAV